MFKVSCGYTFLDHTDMAHGLVINNIALVLLCDFIGVRMVTIFCSHMILKLKDGSSKPV